MCDAVPECCDHNMQIDGYDKDTGIYIYVCVVNASHCAYYTTEGDEVPQ